MFMLVYNSKNVLGVVYFLDAGFLQNNVCSTSNVILPHTYFIPVSVFTVTIEFVYSFHDHLKVT